MRSDEDLMLAVKDGDLGAFETLVLRHQSRAWRLAYQFTGDAAEAEDLAQEAFLRILDAVPRHKPTATFRTFLFRILQRLCIDHARRKRPAVTDSLRQVPDHLHSPLQQASQAEREARIRAALDALPADYRMVVLLRYFEGLSVSETAQVMGRSVKAAERLLARAKAILEPRLKGLLAD